MNPIEISKKDNKIIIKNTITDESLIMLYPYNDDLYWILIGNQNNGSSKFIIPNTDPYLYPKIAQLFDYLYGNKDYTFTTKDRNFNIGANAVMRRELFDNYNLKFSSDENDHSSITISQDNNNFIINFNSITNSFLKSIKFSTGPESKYRSAVYPFIDIYHSLNHELTNEKKNAKAI